MAEQKITNLSVTERRAMIGVGHTRVSVARQCALLGLSRSSYYYRPRPPDPFCLELMHALDRLYTRYPFYGVRRLVQALRQEGYAVNHKRVHRLMQVLGLQAIPVRRRLSAADASHRIYPYLLRRRVIDRPDLVWASDITYLPLRRGFVYLVAVMDWFSRYVLSWRLANNPGRGLLPGSAGRGPDPGAPRDFQHRPGTQFTSSEFTQRVEAAGVRMSMDGRGRCWDNIFIERLWRSLKYEDIYLKGYELKGYETVAEIRQGVDRYFEFYNQDRFHQALGYATPAQVYRAA